MKTAFVLSGGGSLGAVQVGMMQALADRQISPDLLVGTSAGAVNAVFVAARGTGPSVLNELATLWAGLRRRDVFGVRPLRALAATVGAAASLCTDRGLRTLLAERLPLTDLQHAAIPVHVVATDLLSGEEALLSDGDAVSAVLASTAIPGILPPVRREGRVLVDGGLADNAAISQAIRLGADRVYVLPTGYACALPRVPQHPVAAALHSLSLLLQQRLIHDVARYADDVDLVVLPPLCPLAVTAADFGHARELIDRARVTSATWLASDLPWRAHPESTLAFHEHRRGAGQDPGISRRGAPPTCGRATAGSS